MKIVNLMENTAGHPGCLFEHGLSFYIETDRHRLLMDTGASDGFLANAHILGIDLTRIDTLILSHGHYDHSGGILAFARQNPTASIYMQKKAGDDYYHLKDGAERYIGIDKEILQLPQLICLEGDCRIDEELFLFTGIRGQKCRARSNLGLKRKVVSGQGTLKHDAPGQDIFEQDTFDHEQCLVVTFEGRHILLSGCAHNGILNILDHYRSLFHADPDLVISGFHMAQKSPYTDEDILLIEQTARELLKTDSIFYTGHCTGLPAFTIMKTIMGGRLRYVHSGDQIFPDPNTP